MNAFVACGQERLSGLPKAERMGGNMLYNANRTMEKPSGLPNLHIPRFSYLFPVQTSHAAQSRAVEVEVQQLLGRREVFEEPTLRRNRKSVECSSPVNARIPFPRIDNAISKYRELLYGT